MLSSEQRKSRMRAYERALDLVEEAQALLTDDAVFTEEEAKANKITLNTPIFIIKTAWDEQVQMGGESEADNSDRYTRQL